MDAQGFLALQGIFVSFMSGNTTLLGVALAPGNWGQAGSIGLVIGLFLAGSFVGAFLSGAAGRRAMPAVVIFEAAILVIALILFAGFGFSIAAGVLLAFAMGAQNAVAIAVGPVREGVTYVTGSLSSAGQELGKMVRGVGSSVVFVGNLSSWVALLAGVVAGAAADARFGLIGLAVPAVALLALAVCSALAMRRR